jgi:3-oxoacyl-[acyl-carrier protein] reductase
MRLLNKVAIVTGAAAGIGRATAEAFIREGATVLLADRDGPGAESVASALGPEAVACATDVSRADDVKAMVGRCLEAFGRLDILVNNAGIGMPRNLDEITPEEFDQVFTVNTKASLFIAQQAARRMGAGGRIINISSMVGNKAYGGFAIAYGASKAAIDYMTTAMAVHLGPRGITVNTIAPGATNTDFIGAAMENEQMVAQLKAETALRDIGDPRDIAKAVAMIASPDSKWITGERIRASGGTLL